MLFVELAKDVVDLCQTCPHSFSSSPPGGQRHPFFPTRTSLTMDASLKDEGVNLKIRFLVACPLATRCCLAGSRPSLDKAASTSSRERNRDEQSWRCSLLWTKTRTRLGWIGAISLHGPLHLVPRKRGKQKSLSHLSSEFLSHTTSVQTTPCHPHDILAPIRPLPPSPPAPFPPLLAVPIGSNLGRL